MARRERDADLARELLAAVGADRLDVPSTSRAAQMPNASQAQLAYQVRTSVCTRNGVGTPEKGLAILISPVSESSTNA